MKDVATKTEGLKVQYQTEEHLNSTTGKKEPIDIYSFEANGLKLLGYFEKAKSTDDKNGDTLHIIGAEQLSTSHAAKANPQKLLDDTLNLVRKELETAGNEVNKNFKGSSTVCALDSTYQDINTPDQQQQLRSRM